MIVKVLSHRATEKLEALFPDAPAHFSFRREGTFYRLADAEGERALAITGVTKSRDGDDLLKCWTTRGRT